MTATERLATYLTVYAERFDQVPTRLTEGRTLLLDETAGGHDR